MERTVFSSLVVMLISACCWNLAFAGSPLKSNLFWKECPGVALKGKLLKAQFNGTTEGPIAILHKGTHVEIDFTFQTNVAETNLTSVVAGKIGVLPYVNFPLANPNACKDSGVTCPVKPGVQVDYHSILDVKSFYPSVNVMVKWELKDADHNDVFCITIPAKLEA